MNPFKKSLGINFGLSEAVYIDSIQNDNKEFIEQKNIENYIFEDIASHRNNIQINTQTIQENMLQTNYVDYIKKTLDNSSFIINENVYHINQNINQDEIKIAIVDQNQIVHFSLNFIEMKTNFLLKKINNFNVKEDFSISKKSIILLTWVLFISVFFIEQKNNKNLRKADDLLSLDAKCIDHDMVCSGTGGDAILDLIIIKIGIIDCCIKHDIDLWCSKDGAKSANSRVVDCVTMKIFNDIAGYIFPVNLILLDLLLPIIMSLHFIAQLIVLLFDMDPNYPYTGGGVGWSCLCGGPVETYCCNPEKNPELCLNKQGQLKTLCGDCYPCYWKCIFDDNGNPIFDKNGKQSKMKITDPTPRKRPCCRNIDNEKYRKPCAI